MTTAPNPGSEQLFNRLFHVLTDGQSPRLWSFVVTIFGDLAQDEDARISGSLMGALVARIGAKPEALRVALHRLRKEGWLESHRQGRSSDYALSAWGRAQSAQASEVIYGTRQPPEEAWLVLRDPAAKDRDTDHAAYALTSAVSVSLTPPAAATALALPLRPNDDVPDWINTKLCDNDLVAASRELEQRLEQVLAHKGMIAQMPALDRMVLRVLVVHSWRRLILKAPAIPAFLFPQTWRGQHCASQVADLLEALPPVTLEQLADAV